MFPVRSGPDFYQFSLASAPDPKTGKPNPDAMKAFLAEHPETARAFKAIGARVPASGFANSTFNGLNAFQLIDASGRATPVRWSLVPEEPFAPGVAPTAPADPNFLFDALIAQLSREPVRYHLILTIGQAGDVTNDATQAWPKDRQQVDAGTVVLDRAEGEATSPARTVNYDPLRSRMASMPPMTHCSARVRPPIRSRTLAVPANPYPPARSPWLQPRNEDKIG